MIVLKTADADGDRPAALAGLTVTFAGRTGTSGPVAEPRIVRILHPEHAKELCTFLGSP